MPYPTVTLTGTYQHVDGTPAKGSVDIAPTVSIIRDTDGNAVLSGSRRLDLDETGKFTIALPATDGTGLDPTGFGYAVTPRLHHASLGTVTFGLPASLDTLDMADVTPADPAVEYVPVLEGASAYEVAVRNGFTGTETDWLATLVGPQGADSTVPGPPGADSTVPGPKGDTGSQGPTGPPGTTTWAGITDKPATFPPTTTDSGDLAAATPFTGSMRFVRVGLVVVGNGNISRATGFDTVLINTGIVLPAGMRPPLAQTLNAQVFYNSTATYRFKLLQTGEVQVQQTAANTTNMTMNSAWFV